jgi:peptidoglycan/xylan/chitin deacetylase (PgdA/CDA1 family)
LNLLIKPVLSGLARRGAAGRLSILIFHRVLPEPDPLFPGEMTRERFDRVLAWVKSWFNVLPLDEAAARLQQGRLPARALALTFDDGYADNRVVAAPLLQQHGLPCTFFVATGFLDGGRMWNDTLIEAVRGCTASALDLRGLAPELGLHALGDAAQRRQLIEQLIAQCKYMQPEQRLQRVQQIAERAQVRLPDDLMMSSVQVQELHRMGMQIGAHTVNHPILARLQREEALQEIADSKRTLERVIQAPVTLFAYPNGKPGEDYSAESVQLARSAGFAAAVSTQPGVSTRATDPFQLRRFTPWDRQRWRFGLRMARNLMHDR